jgi:hypothetical protein
MKAGQSKLLHFFGSEHETDVKVRNGPFAAPDTLGRKKTCTTVAVVVQETEGKAHLLGHQEKNKYRASPITVQSWQEKVYRSGACKR